MIRETKRSFFSFQIYFFLLCFLFAHFFCFLFLWPDSIIIISRCSSTTMNKIDGYRGNSFVTNCIVLYVCIYNRSGLLSWVKHTKYYRFDFNLESWLIRWICINCKRNLFAVMDMRFNMAHKQHINR